jgi:tetratricopeptide (TPR) repeat protein/2-polyprenyl-3-methyl-5-hydroxy-6-metoxy-1,4-benzoquinol methylase
MEKIGRNDPCPCGSGKKNKLCCARLDAVQTPIASSQQMSLQSVFESGVAHHQSGRLAEAESQYLKILLAVPRHADALHLLGVISLQRGNNAGAIDFIQKALKIRPSEHYYSNLGNALKAEGRRDEAIGCYRQALLINPDLPEAHSNLGNALIESGELDKGIACCRKAIAIQPRLAEAHINLGNAVMQRGLLHEAADCYKRALAISPNLAEAYINLGHALKGLGEFEQAVSSYRRALAIRPDSHDVYLELAATLIKTGRQDLAIDSYLDALHLDESAEAKLGFVGCIKDAHFNSANAEIREYVIRAISEAWTRPADLLTPAKSLIELNSGLAYALERANDAWPARLSKQELFGDAGLPLAAQDFLFESLLENVAINSVEFERLLTMVRKFMLDDAFMISISGKSDVHEWAQLENFYSAIARQCFINEYVYSSTNEELIRLDQMRTAVNASLSANLPVHPMCLIAIAAYVPLNLLACAGELMKHSWPVTVTTLLNQQIIEPATERNYRAVIPRLTVMDEGVSRLVQEQYEENPYPRWVQAPRVAKSASVDALIRHQFPKAGFRPLGKTDELDILIAGCGTGQHPIQVAQQFAGVRVLAIDLSLSSLCYAKRKTDELGFTNIEYAQADIMQCAVIEKTFDVIESVGVLHHLADPVAGWKVLLGLLQPDGLMCVGLYSGIARQDIVKARSYIARKGYAASADDIRRCRQDLMAEGQAGQFQQFISSKDFYGMSDCRDLLFHVQEHRFTLPQLKGILAELGLSLIGIMVDSAVAARYVKQFPDDPARTNLDHWHLYETQNPDTFARMYQFWVQREAR